MRGMCLGLKSGIAVNRLERGEGGGGGGEEVI